MRSRRRWGPCSPRRSPIRPCSSSSGAPAMRTHADARGTVAAIAARRAWGGRDTRDDGGSSDWGRWCTTHELGESLGPAREQPSRAGAWRSRSCGCASSCGIGSPRSRPPGTDRRRGRRRAAPVERDLHDGAQQRLISIGLELRHIQQGLAQRGCSQARRSTTRPRELTAAIGELRELARGDRPGHPGRGPGGRRCGSWRGARPWRWRSSATYERFERRDRGRRLLRGVRGPDERGEARARLGTWCQRGGRGTARSSSRSATTAGRGAPVARVGLERVADRVVAHGGHLGSTARPVSATVLVAELPCGSRLPRTRHSCGTDSRACSMTADTRWWPPWGMPAIVSRAAVSEHRPDLAVVDVRMPPASHDEENQGRPAGSRDAHPENGSPGPLTAHRDDRARWTWYPQSGFGYLLKDRVLDVNRVPRCG